MKFNLIQIMTTSACSGNCAPCPYSYSWHKKNPGHMSDEEFIHVLDEIQTFDPNTSAKICLYLMQDPLSDPKIVERTETIFQYFPNCKYELSTNGMLLTPEISKQLVDVIKKYEKVKSSEIWLSHFAINPETYKTLMRRNNYQQTLQNIIDFLKINDGEIFVKFAGLGGSRDGILEYFNEKQYVEYINSILNREQITIKNLWISYFTFHNRAGNVRIKHWDGTEFHRQIDFTHPFSCMRYIDSLHILYDGSVIACCMDYFKETVWGNLFEQTLKEIWEGQERKKFIEKAEGRIKSDYNFICKRCISPGG